MQRFSNILFVVTPDTHTQEAFNRAAKLADNNQANLTIVEVVDDLPRHIKLPVSSRDQKGFQEAVIAEHLQQLDSLADSSSTKSTIETKVLIGTSFMEIIKEVLRNKHDLVIKVAKTESQRFQRLFGSDDMHLLRKCPCPVLLINPDATDTSHRILACVDVNDNYPQRELDTRHRLNVETLELATSLALFESSELHIVHAWRAIAEGMMQSGFIKSPDIDVVNYVEEVRQQEQQKMDTLMGEITRKLGNETMEYLEPQVELVKGWPREEIPDFANKINADLVVMGTVARTGIPGLIMGNTAETILNQISCSVLAIKPPGFVSPVSL